MPGRSDPSELGASAPGLFDRLIHADWSTSAKKRWLCSGRRSGGVWTVDATVAVPSSGWLLDDAEALARAGHRVLLGFDFPIGLPIAYATQIGFAGYPAALFGFGRDGWQDFFRLCDAPAEIGLRRPFYPRVAAKGVSPASLVASLGVAAPVDLLRRCERKTASANAACSLFWTLGGNQVGRAAMAGWQEIVRPALEHGMAKLWPFHGWLRDLAIRPGFTIAETYPALACRQLWMAFGPLQSKRRQADRMGKAPAIRAWAQRRGVHFTDGLLADVDAGFGAKATGEDAFDALAGLLGMIEVSDGVCAEGPVDDPQVRAWEGWILGRPF